MGYIKHFFSLIAIVLVFGCSPKQSPESKQAVAQFASQDVKAYISVMSPNLDTEKMIDTFPALIKKWESIEQKYTLPQKKTQRVNDALNLQKLFLLYFEGSLVDYDSMNGEENRYAYKQYTTARDQIIGQISDKYWKHLSSNLNDDAKSALNALRTKVSADALQDNAIGSVDMIIGNLGEMIAALTSLTK